MLEILEFIFSSFWIWLGMVILIATAGASLRGIFLLSIVKKARKRSREKTEQ